MPQKQGGSKKARSPKTSKGINAGAKKQRPPMQLLIAMDKGMAHKSRPRRAVNISSS